jgi:8-oxo-dGTP diphosphatase
MTVRAAGGVVIRTGTTGPEVLVVHRPRHDDWSLPKGKADPGEDPATTALREVEEETGWVAEITGDLGEVHYLDERGRPKTVAWFRMRPLHVSEHPTDDEVDEMRWLAPADAARLLTYATDRALLEDLG